jgi:coenzyme Q-binding protein COQ10
MHTHTEKVFSPYSKEQLFALVMDIEKYPEFLPWCSNAKIIKKESDDLLYADLTINFKRFFHSYTSKITILESKTVSEHFYEINVEMTNGPFKKLHNKWRFDDTDNGSYISFFIDLELKSSFFNIMLNFIFDHSYKKMLRAFENRAKEIYA